MEHRAGSLLAAHSTLLFVNDYLISFPVTQSKKRVLHYKVGRPGLFYWFSCPTSTEVLLTSPEGTDVYFQAPPGNGSEQPTTHCCSGAQEMSAPSFKHLETILGSQKEDKLWHFDTDLKRRKTSMSWFWCLIQILH